MPSMEGRILAALLFLGALRPGVCQSSSVPTMLPVASPGVTTNRPSATILETFTELPFSQSCTEGSFRYQITSSISLSSDNFILDLASNGTQGGYAYLDYSFYFETYFFQLVGSSEAYEYEGCLDSCMVGRIRADTSNIGWADNLYIVENGVQIPNERFFQFNLATIDDRWEDTYLELGPCQLECPDTELLLEMEVATMSAWEFTWWVEEILDNDAEARSRIWECQDYGGVLDPGRCTIPSSDTEVFRFRSRTCLPSNSCYRLVTAPDSYYNPGRDLMMTFSFGGGQPIHNGSLSGFESFTFGDCSAELLCADPNMSMLEIFVANSGYYETEPQYQTNLTVTLRAASSGAITFQSTEPFAFSVYHLHACIPRADPCQKLYLWTDTGGYINGEIQVTLDGTIFLDSSIYLEGSGFYAGYSSPGFINGGALGICSVEDICNMNEDLASIILSVSTNTETYIDSWWYVSEVLFTITGDMQSGRSFQSAYEIFNSYNAGKEYMIYVCFPRDTCVALEQGYGLVFELEVNGETVDSIPDDSYYNFLSSEGTCTTSKGPLIGMIAGIIGGIVLSAAACIWSGRRAAATAAHPRVQAVSRPSARVEPNAVRIVEGEDGKKIPLDVEGLDETEIQDM